MPKKAKEECNGVFIESILLCDMANDKARVTSYLYIRKGTISC